MTRRERSTTKGLARRVQWALAALALVAAVVLWAVASRSGGGSAAGVTPLVSDDVHALIERARDLAVSGRETDAASELRAAIAARPAAGDPDAQREDAILGWELVVLERLAGEGSDEQTTRDAYRAITGARRPLRPGETFAGTYSFDGAPRLLLERLPPGLHARDAPQHALAAEHIAAMLAAGPQSAGAVAEHVLQMGEHGPDALPAVLLGQARSGRSFLHLDPAIRRCVAGLSRERVEQVLAAVADDQQAEVLLRRCCERWLGEVGDVPIALTRQGRARDLLRHAFPEGEILAAWRRLRELPALEALRARLALADDERAVAGPAVMPPDVSEAEFRTRAPRTEEQALFSWIARHTALVRGQVEAGALDDWTPRDADLVALLRTACGLDDDAEVVPRHLLRRMETEKSLAPVLHRLLSLAVPADVEPPTWLAGSGLSADLVTLWRTALGVEPDRLPLRVAHWELREGRWRLVQDGERRTEVVEGAAPESVPLVVELGPIEGLELHGRVPGMGFGGEPGRRYEQVLTLRLWRGRDGLELGASASQRIVARASAQQHGGGGGDRWTVPFTISPTVGVGSGSTPDRFRNRLTLVRPEPTGAELPGTRDGTWDESAWRAAIAADLGRLADLAEDSDPWWEFHNVHQRTLWNLSAICMTIDVPEALPALRRLLAQAPRWEFELSRDLLLLAALHSGATDLVGDPRVRFLAAGKGLDGTVDYTIGPGPKSWVRLWMLTDDPATRGLAESAIAARPLSGELASDVRAAIAVGAAGATPGMEVALAAAPASVAPTFRQALLDNAFAVACVAALDIALVVLLVLLARGALRGGARPRTSAGLVALGLVASSVSVLVFGNELLPTTLGLLAAATGAWHLAGVAASRWGRGAGIAFGVAALGVWLHPAVESLATCVGVIATAALGRDLLARLPTPHRDAPRRPGAAASPRLVVLALLLAPIGAAGLFAALRGLTTMQTLVLAAGGLFAGAALGAVAPRIARFDPAAPRERWPPLFVLLYVVPVGGSHLLWAFLVTGLTGPFALSGGWAALVLTGAAVAALWCVGRLLDGARATVVTAATGRDTG